MCVPSKRVASGPLERGWAELRGAQWSAARTSFSAALAEEETPEALEGLSWAAWWLDDADALFDSRARAYRLYRKRGQATGAARMATWLAVESGLHTLSLCPQRSGSSLRRHDPWRAQDTQRSQTWGISHDNTLSLPQLPRRRVRA